MLFINADREYREGKSQNFLRPEDISKIVHAYRERVFVPPAKDAAYADFAPEVTDRRARADLVKGDPGLAKAHARFLQTLEAWWKENQPAIEGLAPKNGKRGNVYDLRRQILASSSTTFAKCAVLLHVTWTI